MQSWTEIKKIENPTEEQQLEAVKLNWYAISLIENPSPAAQKAAFEQNVQAILYIKNGLCEDLKVALNVLDETAILAAVNADPNILKFVTNPDLLKAAVRADWKVVRKIENASDDLWAEAVRVSADALKYVPDVSEKIQEAMVERDWHALQDNPVSSNTSRTDSLTLMSVMVPCEAFIFFWVKSNTRNPADEMKPTSAKSSVRDLVSLLAS